MDIVRRSCVNFGRASSGLRPGYMLCKALVLGPVRPAKSTGLPSRLPVFLHPFTDLLGGRTFLLVKKKKTFLVLNFFF